LPHKKISRVQISRRNFHWNNKQRPSAIFLLVYISLEKSSSRLYFYPAAELPIFIRVADRAVCGKESGKCVFSRQLRFFRRGFDLL